VITVATGSITETLTTCIYRVYILPFFAHASMQRCRKCF